MVKGTSRRNRTSPHRIRKVCLGSRVTVKARINRTARIRTAPEIVICNNVIEIPLSCRHTKNAILLFLIPDLQ